jgi:holo-[acyl-carrier protein] synthase
VSDLVGVGIDLVDVERLAAAIRRRPGLLSRVFTDAERVTPSGARRRDEALAARFAAKEATMKALGVGLGSLRLRDVEVVSAADGRPQLALHGTARAIADRRGVEQFSVSLTHTAGLASAVVVAAASS